MDELTRKLREDAARIDATISPELEGRISASLEAAAPSKPAGPRPVPRPWTFWLASSLTGAAVALAVIAFFNLRGGPQSAEVPQMVDSVPPGETFEVPSIDLRTETAVLTTPLAEELDALRSDLRKVEEKVRDDMGL
jgi:hypothetical protein